MFLVIDIKNIILFVAISISLFTNAQVDEKIYNSKTKVVRKAGNKAFKKGDFYGATAYYDKFLIEKDTVIKRNGIFVGWHQNIQVKYQYKLAESYRLTRDYLKSERLYMIVFEAKPKKYLKSQFYLAQMQMMSGKYQKAKNNFTQFKDEYKDPSDSSKYKEIVKLYLKSCNIAPEILEDTLDVRVFHPDNNVNKSHVELSPFPLNDSILLFSSLRSDTLVYRNIEDSLSGAPRRKFYVAKKENDSTWINLDEYADGWFNLEDTENGNGCFNLDSSRFFFSRGIRNAKGKLIFHLYYSDREDDRAWGEPIKMSSKINSKNFHSTQPAIGWDLEKQVPLLYFVSNRTKGSRGGWDIWFSEFDSNKNEWKTPKNGGNQINTILDEMSPRYNIETKTMYFSSQGWPGLGGFDIFKTKGEMKEWSEPQNIGYPINTKVDELYFSNDSSGDAGYFVSNRKGSVSIKNSTCCDDIYYFKENERVNLGVKGKTFELKDSEMAVDTLISSAITLSLVLLYDSIESGEVVIKSVLPEKNGDYFFDLEKGKDYTLKANAKEFYAQTYEISTKNIEVSDTLEKDFFMQKISIKPIVIKNIYYEFDKFVLLDSSKTVIDTTMLEILNENPDIKVEIGSHTDSRGDDSYNQILSQQRAQSVVDYLINNGVERERLVAKGYGETKPIAPNNNKNGSDNPEGRQMNRRTEFRIIGKIEGVSEIIYQR
ncbi:MAG: hypothetical protein CMD18_03335 [Flavobacteriales bacterium]|nr:hypothetical protein [Flavobacteriales bacterium]